MSVSFVTIATSSNGTSSVTPSYPAAPTSGNLLLLLVSNKHDDHTVSTPAGWTAPANNTFTGGAGTEGTDDEGTTRVTAFYKISDGTETGTVTVTVTSGNAATGQISEYSRSGGTGWDIACAGGSQNSGGSTSWSVTMATDPGINTGDMVVAQSAVNADTYTYSSESISATGTTFGVHAERADLNNAQGADLRHVTSTHTVTGGPSSAAAVYTMTASGSAANSPAGATMIIRLREATTSTHASPISGPFGRLLRGKL